MCGLVVLAGCRCGATDDTPPAPAPPPPAPAAPAPPARVPLTLAQVAALVPAMGEPLVALALSPDQTQAHVAWCVPAVDATRAGEAIAGALDHAGWIHPSTRQQNDTAMVSADQGGFHISVVVRGNSSVACPQEHGHYAANATVFKLPWTPRTAASPTPR